MVFNGVSSGKGHLAEAKAAVRPAAKPAFQNNGHEGNNAGCGGDASQRDELLAKMREARRV